MRWVFLSVVVVIGIIVFWRDEAVGNSAVLFDQSYQTPLKAGIRDELVVTGQNKGKNAALIVLRIEDRKSRDYASRVNEERMVPPGDFVLRLPLSALRRANRKPLDHQAITRILVFQHQGDTITNHRVSIDVMTSLPGGVVALDLGPEDSPVFPGFTPITPKDKRLAGPAIKGRNRPYPDALIGDGIGGINKFTMPMENGTWTLSIWTEDTGEWEFLPPITRRFIRANGTVVVDETTSPMAWLQDRYLAGRSREALVDGDPWQSLGQHRGDVRQAVITVKNGLLRLELSGDGLAATHIAAILLEPVGQTEAFQQIQAERAKRFRETWRHAPFTPPDKPSHLTLTRVNTATADKTIRQTRDNILTLARGETAFLDFHILSPEDSSDPLLSITAPKTQAAPDPARSTPDITLQARFGHWRWERPFASQKYLHPVSWHLRGDLNNMTLKAGLPRRLNLMIQVPDQMPPGDYHSQIMVKTAKNSAKQDLTIRVLPFTLPAPKQYVGLFMENAPHWNWFPNFVSQRDNGRWCDLMSLRAIGLNFLAPGFQYPMTTKSLANDLNIVRASGFDGPLLAYTPAARLLRRSSPTDTAQRIKTLTASLSPMDQARLIWSIADEPTNVSGLTNDPLPIQKALTAIAPDIPLSGHLNHRPDRALLPLFDHIFVNAGYGVDQDDIDHITSIGKKAWYYNMDTPRHAAGFYLWRSRAAGYIQWHGRMPTADPFDTTDGREADYQFLYPGTEACPIVPDIHHHLVLIAQGVRDLSWLSWLDQQARRNPAAAALQSRMRQSVPDKWADMQALPTSRLDEWRHAIQNLAQSLANADQDAQ